MARVFFCFIPAVLGSAIFWLIHPMIGLLSFAAAFYVGWLVTIEHSERGDSK